MFCLLYKDLVNLGLGVCLCLLSGEVVYCWLDFVLEGRGYEADVYHVC